MNKTILVTGAEGMLGRHFQAQKKYTCLTRKQLDITDVNQVRDVIKKIKPKCIVHLAAMTNVDEAQLHPEIAYEVNSIGSYNIAKQAQQNGSHLIYVSTAAVFSGEGNKAFTTLDRPFPRNVYAQSKYIGEKMSQDICKAATIVRTGWLFGGFELDHKFVGMIARQIWEGKTSLSTVAGTRGCPTYTQDLKESIESIIVKRELGIIHAVNKGSATRSEIALEMVKILHSQAAVKELKSSLMGNFTAPRPHFEVIKQNIPLRHWKIALKEYLNVWQNSRLSQ